MNAHLFQYSAKQLKALDQSVLGFLIASGHCCNELSVLMPYIVFEQSLKDANDIEAAFILTRRFTIDRIIVSKIVEYDEMWRRFLKMSADVHAEFLKELIDRYRPIAEEIKAAKWARILRNKASFHFDGEYAYEALMNLDDEHPLRLFAGRIKGITLFDLSEEAISQRLFRLAGDGDVGNGMAVVEKFVREMIGSITSFHAQVAISVMKKHGILAQRQQCQMRDQYCAVPGELRVPLSIASSYIEAVRSKEAGKDP
jgi:hypothetical protein